MTPSSCPKTCPGTWRWERVHLSRPSVGRGRVSVLWHKLATIWAWAGLLVGSAYPYMVIPKGFLPSEDIDQFNITTEAAEGVSFDSMIEHQLEINRILMADPNVEYVMSQVGFGRGTMNQGGVTVRLKPRAERPQVEQVSQELRPKLAV